MADYSIPLQVQTPAPMSGLGNILNVVQGAQQIEQQNIQLQAQRQANNERKNFISLMQQDPTMRPGPDGTFDLGPANTAKILAAMPQTGADQIQKLADTNQRMTQARQSIFDLGVNNAKAFGNAVNDLSGKPVSDRVAALQDLQSQFPGTKPFVDMYTHGLNQVQSSGVSDQQKNEALGNLDQFWSRWHMDVQAQQTAGTPQYGELRTPGGGVNVFQTKPGVPGAPQTSPTEPTGKLAAALGPGETESVVFDANQNPFAVRKAPNGTILGMRPIGSTGAGAPPPARTAPPVAGGGGPAPAPTPISTFQNKTIAQNAADAQARWGSAQTRDVDPASGYQATGQVYSNLKKLLDENPNVGPGAAGFNQLLGRIGTATNHTFDPNKGYQEVAGYLDRLAAQNSAATGASTNFAREQQASATGNPEVMGPAAIQEKLRFGSSVNEAAHAYTEASQAYVAKNGQGAYSNPIPFESSWSANANPIAFRLMADTKNGDAADFAATQARVRSMPLDQQQAIHRQYLNLKNYLLKGHIPPNG